MAAIKTAISLRESLFQEMEATCNELGISRSRLVSEAVREFLSRHRRKALLARLNAATADGSTVEEEARADRILAIQRTALEKEW